MAPTPSPGPPAPDCAVRRDLEAVFSVVWAIAHIGHILRQARPSDPLAWLVLASALLLIGRPTSRHRLGAMAVMQLGYLFEVMPKAPNHLYMMGFINAGLLLAVIRPPVAPGLPTGYLLGTLLVSYGASAVSKLNSGFFDPATSCAVTMFYDAGRVIGLARGSEPLGLDRIEPALPYVIASVELLIPALLIVKRTRGAAILLVVPFHLAISLSPTSTAIDFMLALFAMCVVLLPSGPAAELLRSLRRIAGVVPSRITHARLPALVVLALLLAMALVLGWGSFPRNRNWIWLAPTALALGGLLVHAVLRGAGGTASDGVQPAGYSYGRAGWLYGALAALQMLNVSAPYLGSKNVGSFVMYSNLRTEGRRSNHFLLPRWPGATGQDDLIEIVDSSNARLRSIHDRGLRTTWHELRRVLSDDPNARVAYRRAGALYTYEQARQNPELVRINVLARKLIGHRLIDPAAASCGW